MIDMCFQLGKTRLHDFFSFQIYRHITHEVERIDIYETHQSTNFVQRQGIFGGSGGTGMTAQVSTIKFLQLKLGEVIRKKWLFFMTFHDSTGEHC